MTSQQLVPLPPTAITYAVPLIPRDYAHPGLTLSQLSSILWAYRRVTLLILILCLILSALVAVVRPKTYRATAVLMVDYEVNDPLGDRAFPLGLLGGYMATQVELMQSPEVLLAVVDRLHLTQDKDYTAGYRGDGSTLRQWAAHIVLKNLSIWQGQSGSELINVTYSGHHAKEAADIANMLASVYTEQHLQRTIGPASARAKRYADQLTDLKQKVNLAQAQVTEFRTKNGLISLDSNLDNESQNLQTLEQQLIVLQDKRRAAAARIAGDPRYGSAAIDSSLIQGLKTQLADKESHLAQLRSTLGPRYPKVVELESEIAATHRSLETAIQNYANNARSDLVTAQSQEKNLQAAVDKQRQDVIHTRQLQDEGEKYLLNLQSAQSVYKRMLDGYDQMTFASRGQYSNISIASRAITPLQAIGPKARKAVFIGGVLGLALGLFGPLCYELLFHRRVRCRDDLEHDHGIVVLGEFDAIQQMPRSVA